MPYQVGLPTHSLLRGYATPAICKVKGLSLLSNRLLLDQVFRSSDSLVRWLLPFPYASTRLELLKSPLTGVVESVAQGRGQRRVAEFDRRSVSRWRRTTIGARQKEWLTNEQAATLLDEPELVSLLMTFRPADEEAARI